MTDTPCGPCPENFDNSDTVPESLQEFFEHSAPENLAALAKVAGQVGTIVSAASGLRSLSQSTNPAGAALDFVGSGGVSNTVQGIRDVASLVSDAGAALSAYGSTISFRATPGRLRTRPLLTGRSQSNQWQFEVFGRGAHALAGAGAKYAFTVNVDFDCYNIRRADISFNESRSSRRGVTTGKLTLTIRPRTGVYETVPGSIEFVIRGNWDPADTNLPFVGNDQNEPISGTLTVHADGRVQLRSNQRTARYHHLGNLRRVSGGTGSCRSLYAQQQAARGGGTPVSPSPPPGTPRPSRPSRGSGRRPSYSPPAIPHPANGRHIFFAFNRASPDTLIRSEVDQWWMGLSPQLKSQIQRGSRRVMVQGHADPVGSSSANRRISEQRANLVANYIRRKIPGAAVDAAGFGYSVAVRHVARGRRSPEWRRATIILGAN